MWTHSHSLRDWKASTGLYIIFGNGIYAKLPEQWESSCIVSTITPSFFLLPMKIAELLGFPIYASWEKISIPIGNWKDDKWPPEIIRQYYGPAT